MIGLALAIAASATVGVWAERRYEDGARTLSDRLLWIGLWVILPTVGFINLNVLELDVEVGAGIAFGLCALGGCLLINYVAGRHVLRLGRRSTGAMMLTSWGNTGYLGLPVAAALLGTDALPDAIAYDIVVHTLTFVTVGFAIGAAFGPMTGGAAARVRAFALRNPPLWATIAAFALPRHTVPDWLVDASHLLVYAMVPIGFFAVGVVLATVAEEGAAPFPPRLSPPLLVATAAKCVVSPAIVLALSALVVRVPDAYVSQAAMACGIMPLAVAQTYGLDRAIVAGVIAVTTSIALIWGLGVSLL